ncbi:MAG: ribosome silencing factor [Rickettsiales bacterium]
MKKITSLEKEIDQTLEDSKATDVAKINVGSKSTLCDYFYIATGTSGRHVKSIADHIVKKFKDLGMQSVPIEGSDTNSWVVIDLGDAIIHIFQKEARDRYKLEDIWNKS